MLYDVFISHASEDKETVARPLAEKLREYRLEVWYDEFTLKPGDSLSRSIDLGLAQSRFGIVVLSPRFFEKRWPQWELGGLVQRHNASRGCILPVWHNVSRDDVLSQSPPLVDLFAVRSDMGIDRLASRLLEVIRPEGSTLIIARDHLLDFGCAPPVVTDDWWLDVVEASACNDMEGTFQEAMGWGRWGFPLPPKSIKPAERGERLAWAAMQMMWREQAESRRISQVTHPHEVLDFIASEPGLRETCHDFPWYLASYAPQLTITGFGGEFEGVLDKCLEASVARQAEKRRKHDRTGSALTTDNNCPACDELFALRHPKFGYYQPSLIACQFVSGKLMGPEVRVYENVDYIAWLLSTKSGWLPEHIRRILIDGMKDWKVWPWMGFGPGHDEECHAQTGSLASSLFELRGAKMQSRSFELNPTHLCDLQTRLAFSARLMGLPESGEQLADLFLMEGFIDSYLTPN